MANDPRSHEDIATMRRLLFIDVGGILNEQFVQVEQLGNNDPHFVEGLLTIYFRESTQSIAFLENAIESPSCNPKTLERPLHKFKGSSASIGAIRVTREIDLAIQACRDKDVDRLKAAVGRMKSEYAISRRRLEDYFLKKRQAGPSESAVRPR